jgi:ABC-type Fe3+ transport system substrate-binding protein
VTERSAKQQPQPENVAGRQAIPTTWGMPRRVCVKGMQGVDATVVVTVVRGVVWMSIMPPFTWEAMMDPEKVAEVIRALESARGEAAAMAVAFSRRPLRDGETAIREITRGPVAR